MNANGIRTNWLSGTRAGGEYFILQTGWEDGDTGSGGILLEVSLTIAGQNKRGRWVGRRVGEVVMVERERMGWE